MGHSSRISVWLRCSTVHAICKSKDIITTTNSDGTTVSMNENLGSQDFEILVAMSAICRTPDLWGRTITAVTVSGTFLGWSSGTSSDPHGLVSMAVVAKVTEVSVIQSKVEGRAFVFSKQVRGFVVRTGCDSNMFFDFWFRFLPFYF